LSLLIQAGKFITVSPALSGVPDPKLKIPDTVPDPLIENQDFGSGSWFESGSFPKLFMVKKIQFLSLFLSKMG